MWFNTENLNYFDNLNSRKTVVPNDDFIDHINF